MFTLMHTNGGMKMVEIVALVGLELSWVAAGCSAKRDKLVSPWWEKGMVVYLKKQNLA